MLAEATATVPSLRNENQCLWLNLRISNEKSSRSQRWFSFKTRHSRWCHNFYDTLLSWVHSGDSLAMSCVAKFWVARGSQCDDFFFSLQWQGLIVLSPLSWPLRWQQGYSCLDRRSIHYERIQNSPQCSLFFGSSFIPPFYCSINLNNLV